MNNGKHDKVKMSVHHIMIAYSDRGMGRSGCIDLFLVVQKKEQVRVEAAV